MKLSIIIPVYNIEDYIGNCIETVIKQDIDDKDYEIIIINDGSTDNSLTIIKAYENKASNIRVATQKNTGLGGAREHGLELASGEYVYFLDGDDYLAHNSLGKILSTAIKNDLEIIGFGIKKTRKMNLYHMDESNGFRLLDDGMDCIANLPDYRVEVWWYLIKRSFLERIGLKFETKRFVNDSYFTPSLFLNAQRVGFIKDCIYRYVIRPSSTTKKSSVEHDTRHIEDSLYAMQKMNELIAIMDAKSKNGQRAIERIKDKQESYSFFSLIRFAKSGLPISGISEITTRMRNLGAYPIKHLKTKEHTKPAYKILTPILNHEYSLRMFIKLMRLVN